MMFKHAVTDKTIQVAILACVILAVAGLYLPGWIINNLMFGLAKGLAVLGLLILWRTGLISFGHALYFGLGAYAVALLEKYTGTTDLLLRFATAITVSLAVSFLLGLVLRRYREIFFAMLSLAFSMVLYGVLIKWERFGSTDGFSVSPATLVGWAPEGKLLLFYSIIVLVLLAVVVVQIYFKSALGQLATAIRDNEIRVEYLGFSVARAIHIKYMLSACLAGAAGALMAMALGQVDPDSMVNWTVSGELVFVTIMSGAGSVIAPFVGAVLFEFIRTYAFEFAPHAWQLIVGSTFLAIIFFLPGGIWSLLERIFANKGAKDA